MPLNVALTGATGFVGRKVVAELLAKKHRVTALVRDVEKADLPKAVKLMAGDLGNSNEFAREADVVIHIAGAISALDRDGYFQVNERGTKSIVEAAIRSCVKRFVHISSLSAREPQLSTYGASKLAGENVLDEVLTKISVVKLRPPAVYGPGDRATLPLIKALTQSLAFLPARADARFSLIYVDDLARIIVDAAMSDKTGVIELDDGALQGHDWQELVGIAANLEQKKITAIYLPKLLLVVAALFVELIAKLCGKPAMISREKINELYHGDWVAREPRWPLKNATDFARGFADTVAWYRQENWLPQPHANPKITT